MTNLAKIIFGASLLWSGLVGSGCWAAGDPVTATTDELIKTWVIEPTNSVAAVGTAGCRSRLNLARQARAETNTAECVKLLISILDTTASEQYKRVALLELAATAEQEKQFARALQILAQYVRRYPDDPSMPAVLLHQGLICRQMGAHQMALAKFYAVMTTALNLKLERFQQYQRLVLQAQIEIAETDDLRGNYLEAADCYKRLLTQEIAGLNKAVIQFKLIRCLSRIDRDDEVVAQAEDFLTRYPEDEQQPEARFLLISALKHLQRKPEALKQVLLLLETEQASAAQQPERWLYWQERAGNDVANELYLEGDYVNALEIYQRLSELGQSPTWKRQALYQAGLTYERLQQPQKAIQIYDQIAALNDEPNARVPAGVQTVLDMAKWRKEYLLWLSQAEQARQSINQFRPPANSPVIR